MAIGLLYFLYHPDKLSGIIVIHGAWFFFIFVENMVTMVDIKDKTILKKYVTFMVLESPKIIRIQ